MPDIDPTCTAILGVHLQNDTFGPNGAFAAAFRPEIERTGIEATIARLFQQGRDLGATIVYLRAAWRADYRDLVTTTALSQMVSAASCLKEGSPGAEIVHSLTPDERDLVITHGRVSGFHGTALDTLLRGAGIRTVALAGIATNAAVESTARAASDHGYDTIVLSDACSAGSQATHAASLDSLGLLTRVMTTDELLTGMS